MLSSIQSMVSSCMFVLADTNAVLEFLSAVIYAYASRSGSVSAGKDPRPLTTTVDIADIRVSINATSVPEAGVPVARIREL